MVGSLVNDNEDVWVKGPEKMSADFIHLYKNDSSSTIFFPISKNQPLDRITMDPSKTDFVKSI